MRSIGVAYPRAALAGNPSDGYFGKTVAFTFGDFSARVTLERSDRLEICAGRRDVNVFESLADLVESVEEWGYYGGIRLIKSAVRVFANQFGSDCELAAGMRISYGCDIPYKLGLGGSSAIVIAVLRALADWFEIEIEAHNLANMALAAERDELGIPAGLQDRVAQAYEGLVYMDFNQRSMVARGCGEYRKLDASQLPPIYVAYLPRARMGSEIVHSDLKLRFDAGDPRVLAAIDEWMELANQICTLIEGGKGHEIGPIIDRNFNLRAELGLVDAMTLEMASAARAAGASVNTTGSGGAIVGVYDDPDVMGRLVESLATVGAITISPAITE